MERRSRNLRLFFSLKHMGWLGRAAHVVTHGRRAELGKSLFVNIIKNYAAPGRPIAMQPEDKLSPEASGNLRP